MNQPKWPLVVMPRVYRLSSGFWRWCKLREVCRIVPDLAWHVGINFSPTPEELVSRFAALTRPNRIPDSLSPRANWGSKKIFRYSADGIGFWGTEIGTDGFQPPYVLFELEIGTPYPSDLFVPEGWAIDTLRAIRLGAVAAGDFGGQLLGFPKSEGPFGLIHRKELIHLGGKRASIIVKDLPPGI